MAISRRRKQEGGSKVPITFREVSKNHFSVVLNAHLKSSLAIRWFGPKFSPKDVPRFYDVASITEVIEEHLVPSFLSLAACGSC
jgi:hypothetical protein